MLLLSLALALANSSSILIRGPCDEPSTGGAIMRSPPRPDNCPVDDWGWVTGSSSEPLTLWAPEWSNIGLPVIGAGLVCWIGLGAAGGSADGTANC